MKKINNKGSTIVTGIVIVMIIFVILGTALGIAIAYQRRAVNEHARKQAYLNGLSVIESIAGDIATQTNSRFLPENTTSLKKVTNVELPNGYTGSMSAIIKYDQEDSNVLYIQVNSTYNQQTEDIQLTLTKKNNQWYKVAYSQIGDEINHE